MASTDAKWKIDTYTACVDVCSRSGPFGHPAASTYGQVVTMPRKAKKFTAVEWFMTGPLGGGTMTFRSELYTWDGTKAGEFVAESPAQTHVFSGSSLVNFRFKFENAKVTPGQQYVVFATVAKDYEETGEGIAADVLFDQTNPLDGGQMVLLSDWGDESLWTTTNWDTYDDFDLGIKATIRLKK